MKWILLTIVCIFLSSCATKTKTSDTYTSQGFGLGGQPFKITKMIYLSRKDMNVDQPCSYQAFSKRYVGKELTNGKDNIRIDEIRSFFMEQKEHKVEKNFKIVSLKYNCYYEGFGVEYDFSGIQIINGNGNPTTTKGYSVIEDKR